ncbi:ADP-ribosylglycohydrolase family protein [Streptomyces sp. NPDC007861]|uniref:ADP-ribosylglycohydrolase family protein n=1 Tax=Streptomyces sp. NPDC007861 TaxID=3154893 RepID=UPI00341159A9
MNYVKADPEKVRRGRTDSAARGMLIGLALGETLGNARGAVPADGPLRAGVCTQLACFTAEGLIRASVRMDHRGIGHPPSVLWHAYCRWAALQGIEADRMRERWTMGLDRPWPTGWLAEVPALAERRGSAPATVAALTRIEQGTLTEPATPSRGWHALGRTLPVAAVPAWCSGATVRETAALTHGDPAAQSAAAHAALLARHCPTGDGVHDAFATALSELRPFDPKATADELDRLTTALRHGADRPGDAAALAHFAPDRTAPSALLGGLYAAASFPERGQVDAALRFASGAPDGGAVACVTGALLGAAHGVEALPVHLVSRHELSWVLDTLARDLVVQFADSPCGSEWTEGWDPNWWNRYPGG